MDTVRLRDHRRRAGRRGRRVQGARARRVGRHHRSALVRRQLPAHRLPAVEVAPRRRRPAPRQPGHVRLAGRLRRARLHGQPAGRAPPSPTTRATSSALTEAGAVVYRGDAHDRRAAAGSPSGTTAPSHELRRDERRRSRSARSPSCRRSRASTRSRPGPTARRRWPASCRRACSSSAAARPAASWPRSTSASASRRRSSSPDRGSSPTDHPRNSEAIRAALERDGVDRADRRPGGAGARRRGHRRRARDRPRRRLDRGGSRDPARGRPRLPARRPRARALRHRHERAGRRSRATAGCASPTGCGSSATRPDPSCTPTRRHYQGELAVRMALGEAIDARLPRAAAGDLHRPGGVVGRADPRGGARARASTRSSSSPTSRRAPRATRSRPRSGT